MKKHLRSLTLNDIQELFEEKVYKEIISWPSIDLENMLKDDWIDLLISIQGTSLLKNESTRRLISTTLTNDEYIFMKKVFHNSNLTIDNIIDKIASLKWKKGNQLDSFLRLFGFTDEIIDELEDKNEKFVLTRNERCYELLDYQFIIKQKVLNMLSDETPLKRMLVQMPTGTGKTKTTTHTIVDYYLNTMKGKGIILWMAHTNILLEQAISTFENVWGALGYGDVSVARLYDTYSFNPYCVFNGIIFIGFQKLMSIHKNDKTLYEFLQKNVRLIVVDEAHRAPAEKTRKAIEGLMTYVDEDRSLIGLTATVGRSNYDIDENEKLLKMFNYKKIGIDVDVLNQINLSRFQLNQIDEKKSIITYLQDRQVLAKLKREKIEYQSVLSDAERNMLLNSITRLGRHGDGDIPESVIKVLSENKARNALILRRLEELNQQKIPTILFACNVTHAKVLSAMLKLKGINNVVVTGEMSQAEKELAIDTFKKSKDETYIIINYEVLTTGFDSTNIKCVFITRPTNSIVTYSQMIGRGLRGKKMGGNKSCLLIDVEDNLNTYTNESMAFDYFESYWC